MAKRAQEQAETGASGRPKLKFTEGYEESDRVAAQMEAAKTRQSAMRFKMTTDDNGCRIVFLNERQKNVHEHEIYDARAKTIEHFTCIAEHLPGSFCALCDVGLRPYYAGVYTILDGRKWTDRKGAVHKNERKLLVGKIRVVQTLKRRAQEQGGSLRGCVFEVHRNDARSSRVGDDFKFIRRIKEAELRQMFGKEAEPLDIEKIFDLRPESEVDRAANRVRNMLSSGESANAAVDEPSGDEEPPRSAKGSRATVPRGRAEKRGPKDIDF